jgi:FkbM family methyltransferase
VDIVRYPVHTTLEGHLRMVLARYGVTAVVDVGANEGQFAERLRTVVGYSGRIESFEPTPATHALLAQRAIADASWHVHPWALGDCDGTATLNLFDSGTWNSLHEPDHVHLREAGRSLPKVGSAEVEVRRLDSVWGDVVGDDEITLVKVDAQGHDAAVMDGARGVLAAISVVMLEGSLTTFYEGETRLPELLDHMADLGFTPSGIFPVTRRRETLALDTVDVCFVATG